MIKKFFLLATIMILISAPLWASAAVNICAIPDSGTVTPDQLPKCVNQIYVWSLGVGALLAVLMVVLGGYSYMTAAGNAEQAEKGKEYIWGAVIGLALLFTAFLLLRIINPDLVDFSKNSFSTSLVCLKDPKAAGCPGAATSTPAP